MSDRCAIPGCRGEVDLVYLDVGICEAHWEKFTTDDAPLDALREALGIGSAPSATEEPMEETEPTTATAEADGQNVSAESPAQEKDMTKKKRSTKKAGPRRAPSPAKAAKAPKPTTAPTPTKAKATDKPNRVFAIRVTDEELAAIHKASGPRNATRFIRAVAAAFANQDEAAFRAVLKEARVEGN